MNRQRRGFSLLEVLMAAMLGSLALIAVMGLLAGGLRVAERLQSGRADAELALAGEQVERDLRNAFPFYGIGFEGRPDGLELAGWTTDIRPPRPVRIRYTWEARRGILRRSVVPFPGEVPTQIDVLIEGLSDCSWSFLNPESTASSDPVWLGWWTDSAHPPPAIRWEVRRPGPDQPAHRFVYLGLAADRE